MSNTISAPYIARHADSLAALGAWALAMYKCDLRSLEVANAMQFTWRRVVLI